MLLCVTEFAVHVVKTRSNKSIKLINCLDPQMDLGQQDGGNTQINAADSRLTPEKTSGATGGRGRAVAAWKTRGTPCQSGVWRTQMKRLAPLTHQELFYHSKYDKACDKKN